MSSESEQRNARLHSAIEAGRGRAETSGGAVVVETDLEGTITKLHISEAAMSVEPERLAKAIMACHEAARERARTEAAKRYTELLETPGLLDQKAPSPNTAADTPEWEELNPLFITRTV
ncbi:MULTISPECIES: YbaB/EbfC family nucleoid-associated protein [unclassified Nocardia]|uniref:YbaB/EbfC family nucleoid-associated protein n=1 Tax=unclassified Nocardia TaxID=2637762 RepID=UPI0024A889D9|nr:MULTISPECIES: YbaB/EbfC family nucleoid-associated protein [unclassified Nocardia]